MRHCISPLLNVEVDRHGSEAYFFRSDELLGFVLQARLNERLSGVKMVQ